VPSLPCVLGSWFHIGTMHLLLGWKETSLRSLGLDSDMLGSLRRSDLAGRLVLEMCPLLLVYIVAPRSARQFPRALEMRQKPRSHNRETHSAVQHRLRSGIRQCARPCSLVRNNESLPAAHFHIAPALSMSEVSVMATNGAFACTRQTAENFYHLRLESITFHFILPAHLHVLAPSWRTRKSSTNNTVCTS